MRPRLKALVDRSSGVWPCQGRRGASPRRGRQRRSLTRPDARAGSPSRFQGAASPLAGSRGGGVDRKILSPPPRCGGGERLGGSSRLDPRQSPKELQRSQRLARKSASHPLRRSDRPHTEQVPIAGEGSWYRPKQAMGMEPSGAAQGRVRGRLRVCSWIDPGPSETSPGLARVYGAGMSNRPVRGSVGVADGPFRATLILPA